MGDRYVLMPLIFIHSSRACTDTTKSKSEFSGKNKKKILCKDELPVIGTVTRQCPVMVRVNEETPGEEYRAWCQSANHQLERFARACFTYGGNVQVNSGNTVYFYDCGRMHENDLGR